MAKKSSMAVTDITQNLTPPVEGAKPAEELLTPAPAPAPVTATHEKVIAMALNAVMQSTGFVEKGGQVAFGNTKYNYSSEVDVLTVIRPAMIKYGLCLLPSQGELRIEGGLVFVHTHYQLTHVSGAVWPHPLSMWGCGSDKGDKAIYKATTGANKYMLTKLAQLACGDDPEAGKQPEEHPYVMPNKDKVLKSIMNEFPGASEMARDNRLAALNQNLLAINGDPVNSPDQVTTSQWDKIAGAIK